MSNWFYENYKGYQICKWSGSSSYFIIKDCDINSPIASKIKTTIECKNHIDNFIIK